MKTRETVCRCILPFRHGSKNVERIAFSIIDFEPAKAVMGYNYEKDKSADM